MTACMTLFFAFDWLIKHTTYTALNDSSNISPSKFYFPIFFKTKWLLRIKKCLSAEIVSVVDRQVSVANKNLECIPTILIWIQQQKTIHSKISYPKYVQHLQLKILIYLFFSSWNSFENYYHVCVQPSF
jgi:hypothetical protein